MVGRTPEYLGKKIQAPEMKLVVLYILVVPLVRPRVHRDRRCCSTRAEARSCNPGPHGLTEMIYAFTSAGEQQRLGVRRAHGEHAIGSTRRSGIAMLVGRFLLMIPALAIAGSLGRKQHAPASAGTFPTDTPLFAGLLAGVVIIVVGLTYFPVLALGPIVEHLVGKF